MKDVQWNSVTRSGSIMELEEKISEMNAKLKEKLNNKKNIVVRGGDIHTERLLSLTCILEFWDKITIVDKRPRGTIGNKIVRGIDEIRWETVDAVIISSLIYQKDMEDELLANSSFKGEIVRLYEEWETVPFFELQKEDSFLTLEKVESWEAASKKSNLGYADEAILQLDYEEFLEHKSQGKKNEIRHYYDVLFYILKTMMQLKKGNNKLSVLDYGGGFGTVFIDLKYYLKNLDIDFKWIIIEQEKIVERCMEEQDDAEIIYKKNLQDIDKKEQIDFVLFGSCLQYLENYQDIIQAVKTLYPYRIAILKTPVSDETFATVQHVNSKGNYNYYSKDYPCRVMKEEELISLFSDQYRLEDSAEDVFNARDINMSCNVVRWKDFFFEILDRREEG